MTGEQKRKNLEWPREIEMEKEWAGNEVKHAIFMSGIKKTCKKGGGRGNHHFKSLAVAHR
jgi:hypothetical protein